MTPILNFIVMIVAGIFMSILYVISVSPAHLEQKIGKSAYKCCGIIRTLSMALMFVVITNYVIYASYPAPLPIPASFPWNYWISFLIAIVITIPSLYLMIRGLIDAGTESAIPKKEHVIYGGIYEKIRHPQAVGELPLWFAIAFFIHSLHMAIFSLVWIPVWYWWCIAEEKDLLLRYGDSYIDYKHSTGRFFPKRKCETRNVEEHKYDLCRMKRRIKLTVLILILICILVAYFVFGKYGIHYFGCNKCGKVETRCQTGLALVGGCKKRGIGEVGYNKNNISQVSLEEVRNATAHNKIIYVDINSNGKNNGSSWSNACNYLQDALAVAQSGQQIWAAEGTYKPDQGINISQGDRRSSFRLKNGVAIYGGFVSGGCDWEDRNPNMHITILSGDLNGDDFVVGDPNALAKDNCSDAQGVFSGMTYKGTTVGATNDGSTGLENDNNPDVWYSYEPSSSGTVTFSVSAEDAYFSVSIHSACPSTKKNELTKETLFGEVSLKVEKNKKYYVRIASLENKSSDFVMSVNSNEDNSRHVVSGSGTNSTAILDGFVIARGKAGHEGGGGMYNRSGSPKLSNCTITENFTTHWGGGIYNGSNSKLELINCIISKNSADRGGGIYNVENSNLKLINCQMSENFSESYGAGIYNWSNSSAILNECVFSRNIAGDVGGAVYIHTGSLEVADCNFTDNSAESFGGAIHNELIELIVTKSLFSNNSAIRGGGIMNSESSLKIDTSLFKGNSAINAGGGIRNAKAKATVTDCNFISNTGGYGAGIENYEGSDVNIVNCTFEKNSATGSGGGISSRHRSKSEIAKCRFIKNHANYAGGGIDNDHSNSTIKDCTFVNNSAQSHGGGAIFNDRGSQSIMDCNFIGNTSRQNGGGILNHQSNTVLTNCTFEGNSAKDFGGGITNVAGATISNCTFSGNAAYRGGGMSNYLGEPHIINCILWGNSDNYKKGTAQIYNAKCTLTINYSCIQSSTRVDRAGNTNADPKFVDEGHWDGQPLNGGKWINGDYHLRSQEGRWDSNSLSWIQDNVTSPCIDAGDPNSSIGYEPSPNGSIINMGRYGGTHEASKSYSNQEP